MTFKVPFFLNTDVKTTVFDVESVASSVNACDFGKKVAITIPKFGDLFYNMMPIKCGPIKVTKGVRSCACSYLTTTVNHFRIRYSRDTNFSYDFEQATYCNYSKEEHQTTEKYKDICKYKYSIAAAAEA